jgi:hypothetical protein
MVPLGQALITLLAAKFNWLLIRSSVFYTLDSRETRLYM